ncbi:MAG: DUF5018 domain-containing protein [Adhaeribacter sp.]
MNKTSQNLYGLLLALLCLALPACLPDVELGPDPVRGNIIRLRFKGMDAAEVRMNDTNINVSFPVGSDITKLVPELVVSKGTTLLNFTEGREMDFSQDVQLQVQGTDGQIITYTIKSVVKEPQPGFKSFDQEWELKHADMGWTKNTTYSIALSRDHLVLSVGARLDYFNALTGEQQGTMTVAPTQTQQIAADDEGVLLGVNYSVTNQDVVIYKWNDVQAAPVEYIRWRNPLKRTTGANSAVGRAKLQVKGDLSKDAVIYLPVSFTNVILRWVVSNGQLVSQQPEQLPYTFSTGATAFSSVSGASPLGPKPEDGYVVASTIDYAYVKPPTVIVFNKADAVNPYFGKVFEFNRAKFFAGWHMIYSTGGYFYVLDITDPAGINMNETQRFEKEINFKPYSSTVFNHNKTPNDGALAGLELKVLPGGKTALFYFLHGNSGIRAYKLTAKE